MAGNKSLLPFAVALAQTADYLQLDPFQTSIQAAIGHHCDVVLKKLCTRNPDKEYEGTASLGLKM